jgi:hypothetical protein
MGCIGSKQAADVIANPRYLTRADKARGPQDETKVYDRPFDSLIKESPYRASYEEKHPATRPINDFDIRTFPVEKNVSRSSSSSTIVLYPSSSVTLIQDRETCSVVDGALSSIEQSLFEEVEILMSNYDNYKQSEIVLGQATDLVLQKEPARGREEDQDHLLSRVSSKSLANFPLMSGMAGEGGYGRHCEFHVDPSDSLFGAAEEISPRAISELLDEETPRIVTKLCDDILRASLPSKQISPPPSAYSHSVLEQLADGRTTVQVETSLNLSGTYAVLHVMLLIVNSVLPHTASCYNEIK